MTMHAILHEIFSSFQGEGPYTGEPMTFVRFQGCALRCRWCDTPDSLPHRGQDVWQLEDPPRSAQSRARPNPCTAEQLTGALADYDDPYLALTGGEPLEQADFLAHWLPAGASGRTVLLETSGIMTAALCKVMAHIQIISMDIKLPTSTGMRAYWSLHEEFLRMATDASKAVYVKMVVDADTSAADIDRGAALVARIDPTIPVVIQRASPTPGFQRIPLSHQLGAHLRTGQQRLACVAVGRQMHKVWQVR